MKVEGLEHVAVVVKDLEPIGSVLKEAFGLDSLPVETVEKDRVRVLKLELGNTHLELVSPLDSESSVAKFIEKRGEGLHHICLRVDDVDEAVETLKKNEVRMIDETPRDGATGCRIAFVHPKSVGGVLVELSQPGDDHGE